QKLICATAGVGSAICNYRAAGPDALSMVSGWLNWHATAPSTLSLPGDNLTEERVRARRPELSRIRHNLLPRIDIEEVRSNEKPGQAVPLPLLDPSRQRGRGRWYECEKGPHQRVKAQ